MRKLMMAVTAVAGLAMVSGCKRDNVESERRDVAEAQQEAQQETAEARQNAQEDIAGARQNEQEEVAGAQQEVREEEKDLAEAQRNQQEELAANQREQQDEMAEDQRELREDTAQGDSGMAGASANVQGRVLSTGGDSLTLVDTSSNKQVKLKTNDQTRIMQNNAPVKLDDITEGTQVRASYVMDGKDMVARELTVTQPVQKKQ